jgi:predicted negative regulator of RcsB-dependent stress response
MFIDLGFSHTGTTISILSFNFIIVAAWFAAYKLGASIDAQLYIVVALSFMATFGFYWFAKRQIERNTKCLKTFQSIAKALHFEKKGIWYTVQRIIDKL